MVLAAVSGVAAAWAGHRAAAVPSVADNATLPLWRLLAMGVGILPALGLHSSLGELENMATPEHRRAQNRYLLLVIVVTQALLIGVAAPGQPADVLVTMLRSAPGWIGLALLSGRLWGWRLSWVAPIVVLCALTYWGGGDGPDDFAWWEFSARSYSDGRTAVLAVALGLVGAAAYSLTPWRLHTLWAGRGPAR